MDRVWGWRFIMRLVVGIHGSLGSNNIRKATPSNGMEREWTGIDKS